MREVEDKLVEVRSGTAKEYTEPLQEWQDQRKSRLEVATALRQLKLTNLQHEHEAGEQAIRQNFENDKKILYDKMKADLELQIQQLEEERIEADFNASLWSGQNLRLRGCGRGRTPYNPKQPKKKRPVVVKGPCIVYQLHKHEQFEDWKNIKKSLIKLKRKEDAEKKNP